MNRKKIKKKIWGHIPEVAQTANVSTKTVSRYLNQPKSVGIDTTLKIQQAIQAVLDKKVEVVTAINVTDAIQANTPTEIED